MGRSGRPRQGSRARRCRPSVECRAYAWSQRVQVRGRAKVGGTSAALIAAAWLSHTLILPCLPSPHPDISVHLQAPGSGKGGDEEAQLDDTKFDEFMGNDAGGWAGVVLY